MRKKSHKVLSAFILIFVAFSLSACDGIDMWIIKRDITSFSRAASRCDLTTINYFYTHTLEDGRTIIMDFLLVDPFSSEYHVPGKPIIDGPRPPAQREKTADNKEISWAILELIEYEIDESSISISKDGTAESTVVFYVPNYLLLYCSGEWEDKEDFISRLGETPLKEVHIDIEWIKTSFGWEVTNAYEVLNHLYMFADTAFVFSENTEN